MKIINFLLVLFFYQTFVWCQNIFQATVKDQESNNPLVGANVFVESTSIGSTTNADGFVEVINVPNGNHQINITYIGYKEWSINFDFPLNQNSPLEIFLQHDAEKMEEVYVLTTRSSRTIDDEPTRVEAISGEELDEKGNMKPGDIRMLLNESTGIQTQQTSATSYNSSIRIQGLDGKYTQILKDGFPLYSGFSGGLSLLQIVPLDLRQVEVIKGAASTLYGGGAIAGLVNLVSRIPEKENYYSFLLNGTSAKGLDVSGFYSKKNEKIGTTIFTSYNMGSPYDPANIGLTAIPKFERLTFNPKVYVYLNDITSFNLGFNSTLEDRIGGDLDYIQGRSDSIHTYFENNKTTRFSTLFDLTHQQSEKSRISIKNTISSYKRSVEIPNYNFSGIQLTSFSELNFRNIGERLEWVAGLNLLTDRFSQEKIDSTVKVDYHHLTLGGFVQNTWNISEKMHLETGLRLDHQNEYGIFILPRFSMLMKANQKLTFRLGGGMGYKMPTVFTEDAEKLNFRNVNPINNHNIKAEESFGSNFDINYRTTLTDKLIFSINSLIFYTNIENPITLEPILGKYEFLQSSNQIISQGVETNIKLSYEHFKLFIGHTFADVKQHFEAETVKIPLVAPHRLNNVLIYEVHDKIRIGLEAYYFSQQKLNDGRTGNAYWIFGLMTERIWGNYSLFINFENFTDTRQTKFDEIYSGPISNPIFNDIYAPVDGFVINGGIKLRF